MSESYAIRILLVEDDASDVSLTLRVLKKANLCNHVEIVRDGAEALALVFREGIFADRSADDDPALILLDLKLPKVHGLEIIERLQSDARARSIPIIVISGSKDHPDVIESLKMGAKAYLRKPLTFVDFIKALGPIGVSVTLMGGPPHRFAEYANG